MIPSAALWVVMTTVSSQEEGQQLAHHLVEERLVACAQVLPPMQSIFRWQGQVRAETEALILLKLPAEGYAHLERRLRELHPYREPEIIALEASQVSPSYLQWAKEQAGSQD
ncbi:MAG: divalent-cation tolerance protein CutA [Synechococcaceae cyanobacterium SM2_3_1]|nr:divalent-cation tolerance protein CutA [Synechococcaceae cyanobacterium SM2_3_1]